MRIVFETQSVPTVGTFTRGGVVQGSAKYVVRVFDAGEVVPAMHHAGPVSSWLGSLASGEPLRSIPPSGLAGPTEAVVPRSLLESLPADSLLAAEWEFVPGGPR
jgi:hypothetical protein